MTRNVLVWGLVLLATACGGGGAELSLSASPDTVPADGVTPIQIVARAKNQSAPGTGTVEFTTTAGSFAKTSRTQTIKKSLSSGSVTVEMYPDVVPGKATVTGQWTTPAKDIVESTVEVTFGETPPVDAGSLRFACESRNLPALDPRLAEPPSMKCTVEARYPDGSEVLNPQVSFLLEAGRMETVAPTRSGESVTYRYIAEPGSGACPGGEPEDVTPLGAIEPARVDSGREHNPRDGLVTIVAYLRGAESYRDANRNGKYDDGEEYDDTGEPYLDTDDDGAWSSGNDCESSSDAIVDDDDDGQPSDPDGRWSARGLAWRSLKVLWTGAPHVGAETSRIVTTDTQTEAIDVPYGGSSTLAVFVVDENLNPIAANGRSDSLNLTISGPMHDWTGAKELGGVTGIQFREEPWGDGAVTGIDEIDDVGSCLSTGSTTRSRCWTVTLTDRDGMRMHADKDASMTATVRYTPVPGGRESQTFMLGPITGKVRGGP